MLYTWGWGKYGQLGHCNVLTYDAPKQVDFFLQNGLCVEDVQCGDWNTLVQTSPAPVPVKTWGRAYPQKESDDFVVCI